jgi:hypothetical protein
MAALFRSFLYFNFHTISVGDRVVTNTGDLPGDLTTRLASSYLEAVVADLLCYIEIWTWSANGGELIAEIFLHNLDTFFWE